MKTSQSADRRIDCLVEMLEELRREGRAVPFFDADRREPWFDALAQLVCALPAVDQRKAYVILLAHDLCMRVPGVDFGGAVAWVQARLGGNGAE
jgi:hypothetical protein